MTATNELRWIICETREPWPDPWNIRVDSNGNRLTEKVSSYPVLQQKWVKQVFNDYGEAFNTDVVEWRNVPTVLEQP